ncbi:ApeI family dehydratase [Neisseria sp. Ec49-e6-T10]|uniref:ApeI family dehydratase n=1 Tax=Neisseria sp. Ec49-e6-T10 TaxID=3140744 RepID=UPI003EC01825
MKLPKELDIQLLDQNHAMITLFVCPELFWLKGHFPIQAILPGVTQVTWVMHYAKTILKLTQPFKGIEKVKFQKPIFPEETIILTLKWHEQTHKLDFDYQTANNQGASNGRIQLQKPSAAE